MNAQTTTPKLDVSSKGKEAGFGGKKCTKDRSRMEIAPLRSLNDFLLKDAKFQIPDFNNEDRWNNRIKNNLLYYQTNYFLSGIMIFLLVTLYHPEKMAYGLGVTVLLFGLSFFLLAQQSEVEAFKRNHPYIFAFGVLLLCYSIIYKLGCIMVVLLGIGLPILFALGHATFRLRNMKNKLTNVSEAFKLSQKTPMAVIFEELGIEIDLKYIK